MRFFQNKNCVAHDFKLLSFENLFEIILNYRLDYYQKKQCIYILFFQNKLSNLYLYIK